MFSMAKIRTYCATYLRNEREILDFCKKRNKNGGISKKTVSSTKHKDLDELLEKYEGRVLLQHKREGKFLFFPGTGFPW